MLGGGADGTNGDWEVEVALMRSGAIAGKYVGIDAGVVLNCFKYAHCRSLSLSLRWHPLPRCEV